MSSVEIKRLLKARGISQSELARRTGVNLRQVQKLVSGEILFENMTVKNALKIADALEIDLHEVIKNA